MNSSLRHLVMVFIFFLSFSLDKAFANGSSQTLEFLPSLFNLQLSSHETFEVNKKTLVISDIDDTLKASHINNLSDASKFSFFTDNPFTGTIELLNYLAQLNGDNSTKYVTNAYKFLSGKSHTTFLINNNYPPGDIYFRTGGNHKYNTIQKLIAVSKPQRVILFGDNAEADIEVYQQIVNDNAGSGIEFLQFIHIAYNLEDDILDIYPDQIGFATSLEVALSLMLNGQIPNNQSTMNLFEHLSKQISLDNPRDDGHGPQIFPAWKRCNQLIWNDQWDSLVNNSILFNPAKQIIFDKCNK